LHMKGTRWLFSSLLLRIAVMAVMIDARDMYLLEYGSDGNALQQFSKEDKKQAFVEHVFLDVPEQLNSAHTIRRRGILTRYAHAQATIVLCHGFMCDKYDAGFLRQLFPRGVYNVFTFDFRAHGDESQGQWCTFGKHEAEEVKQAGMFIKKHPALKNKPVFVYGFSMGAVAAIEAQSQHINLFDAMIVDCPFASSENVIKRGLANVQISVFGYKFGLPGRRLLEKYAFNPYVQALIKYTLKTVAKFDSKDVNTLIYPLYPVESVKNITVPCFFIHCKYDEKISTEDVRAVYDGAQGFKRLWVTNGRRHYDSLFYNPEKYRFQIRQFLQQVLDSSYKNQPKEYVWEDPVEEQVPLLIASPISVA